MQQVKNIVKGPYEPQDNTVIWIDTSNPDAPIAKVHSNGEWQAISGVDNLPTVLNEIVDVATSATDPISLEILGTSGGELMTKEECLNLIRLNGKRPSLDEIYSLFEEKRRIVMDYTLSDNRYILECSSKQKYSNGVVFYFGVRDSVLECGYYGQIYFSIPDDSASVDFYEY